MNKKIKKTGLILILFIGLVITGYAGIARVSSDDFKYRNDYVVVETLYDGNIKGIRIEDSIEIYKKSYVEEQDFTWDFIGYTAPLYVKGFEKSDTLYYNVNNKASYRVINEQFFVQVKYIGIPLKNFGTITYIESGS